MSPRSPFQPIPQPTGGGGTTGVCQTNALSHTSSWNPGVGPTIGADIYEWVASTPPVPSDPSYIALYRGVAAPAATHRARLAKAIRGEADAANITYPAGSPQENFNAVEVGTSIVIVSADAPGGNVVGSVTNVACSSTHITNVWLAAATEP
jgi:hypothetical protein